MYWWILCLTWLHQQCMHHTHATLVVCDDWIRSLFTCFYSFPIELSRIKTIERKQIACSLFKCFQLGSSLFSWVLTMGRNKHVVQAWLLFMCDCHCRYNVGSPGIVLHVRLWLEKLLWGACCIFCLMSMPGQGATSADFGAKPKGQVRGPRTNEDTSLYASVEDW